MFTYILAYLTKLPSGTDCYSTQFRAIASGFMGPNMGSITSFTKGATNTPTTHYIWIAEGTDISTLQASNPTCYIQFENGLPTGNYYTPAEHQALLAAPAVAPIAPVVDPVAPVVAPVAPIV